MFADTTNTITLPETSDKADSRVLKGFAVQEDRHLLVVKRYAERNPLRADLVGRAQDWPWSSLHW